MHPVTPLERLLRRLDLRADGENRWLGSASPGATNNANGLFGGMVFAQAIVAAQRTFADRHVYYATQLFLRPGATTEEITYLVEPLHEGRTYASVQVDASQSGGRIGHLQVSLVRSSERSLPDRSDRPGPVPPIETMAPRGSVDGRDGEVDNPVTFLVDPDEEAGTDPISRYRVRVDPVAGLEPYATAVAGFASDRAMLTCGWKPHRHEFARRGATLNHSLWVHRRFDWSREHTYVLTSASFASGRAIIAGQFHDDTGALIASTSQEAMYRV